MNKLNLIQNQMVIFNQTFTHDKPIYFPDNWGTGKTQMEIYEQWKATLQFSIYSNILQTVISSLFIFIIVAFFFAFKQLHRIYTLPQHTLEKKHQKKYLKPSFLIPLAIIATLCLVLFVFLLLEQWTRNALLKGIAFYIFCYTLYYCYKHFFPILKRWNNARGNQNKIKNQTKSM